ncbi:MAG: PEP/pyruvate-binding domain-containing protein [Candidatus Moranbacteria bacterium]|jgi:phosphoenolpyruvate synthase/pyruvate phosphate dikinase|nr:PEP/pyruvate-binding domain-containing protein [Candidatus Moranbacteria bacterium]
MSTIKKFKEISKEDSATAGGKGASLGEMTHLGINVPGGFVVLASTFEKFIQKTKIDNKIESILDSVNTKKIQAVNKASTEIQTLILGAKIPKTISSEILKSFKNLNSEYVAVRSSATAEDSASTAWAGQLETYLNTNKQELIENIKKCWASLFSSRAIIYRFEKDLHKQKISVAVVVQKMIESEKSGIAFSVHPVTQDKKQIVIEAGFGLGEAIVGGEITPDSYVIKKEPRKIINININTQTKGLYRSKNIANEWRAIPEEKGKKQVLSEKEILDLSEIILKIENHYKFPVDIEWAQKDGKFFILQSRPITTIGKKILKVSFSPEEYEILFRLKDKSNYLINTFLLDGSLKYADPLIINKDGFWTFYLSKKGLKKIEKRGFDLFRKKDLFNQYSRSFYSYINKANKNTIPKYQSLGVLDSKRFKSAIKDLSALWYFYGFTEAVYHDFTYQQMLKTKNKNLKKTLNNNLNTLIGLKEKGRKIFNAYVMKDGIINKILTTIESQKSMETRNASYLTIEELEAILKNKKINHELIKQRKNAYVLSAFKGKLKTFDFEKSIEIARIFENYEKKQYKKAEKEITGVPVSRGIAEGKVIIAPMLDKKEAKKIAEKMKKGDILVVQSTNPDLMILCEKAGAIVTNQGGMLSHAAIISREMKKPCVVGTIFATKILKDGDFVKVDADNGVISILKRI